MTMLPAIDTYFARRKARDGDLDGAIELSRNVVDGLYASGGMFARGMTVGEFIELSLSRGETDHLSEARGNRPLGRCAGRRWIRAAPAAIAATAWAACARLRGRGRVSQIRERLSRHG